MRKRIGIFLVLVFAIFGIAACTKDPYSKMNMTVDNSVIDLTLTEVDKEIKGSSERIAVTVDAPKDISNEIVLPTYGGGYGNEYVDIVVVSNDGAGNYELDFIAKKQGYTEVQIKTLEGYLSETIEINIDVALDSLSFKNDASVVVEIGSTYNFNTYGRSLLQFEPSYTTQTNVRFEIVDANKFKDLATIEDGILKINPSAKVTDFAAGLKVNAISLDNDVKSTELAPLQVKVIDALNLNNSNILKVNLKNLKSQKSVQILNNANTSSESNVNFEVIFASPDVELDPEDAANKLDETLIFGGNLEMTLRRTDYKITYDSEYSEYVDITDSGTSSNNTQYVKSYGLIAKDAGQYTATFKVDYVGDSSNGKYDGMYTKYINVKIKVVALPTSKTILINDETYSNGDNIIAVYDSYAVGMGSKLSVRSTNNNEMTYKVGSTAGAYPVNGNDGMGNPAGVVIELDNALLDTTKPISSGSTLYLQNKVNFDGIANPERIVELRLTLTTDISNEFYSNHNTNDGADRQTYTKTIKVKLNLISGLDKVEIANITMDIVNDKDGKLIHEFDQGVVAKSVVESVRYGNSRLFTYGFGTGADENKMYLYPTPYNPGDSILHEGTTNLVIYLSNGIRSYTPDNGDTLVTVKATYTTNTEGPFIGQPIAITNLDSDNEGFFAFGSIKPTNTYTGPFVGDVNDTSYTKEDSVRGPRDGVYYNQFDNVILATYSELKLDIYKLFIYVDAGGKSQIGYVNANTLTIVATRNGADASHYVQWYNGRLFVYGNSTYDEATGTHTPVVLEIYDGVEKIFETNVFICKRVGKISLVQKHFSLYDGTQAGGTLNDIYKHKASAVLQLKVWEIGENGVLIEDESYILGEYGNFFRDYKMLGATDLVFKTVKRENLLEITYGVTTDILKAHLHVKKDAGGVDETNLQGIGTTESVLKSIYSQMQTFSFDGRLKQFNQEFVIDFSVNIEASVKTSNIATNVDSEMGVYFETGDNKAFKFNYTVYTSQATFKNVFVDVIKPDGNFAQIVVFNNEYKKDLDGNYILDGNNKKIKVYKIYNGFNDSDDVILYNQSIMFDGSKYVDAAGNQVYGIIDDFAALGTSEYFVINIGDGVVNLSTNYTGVGTYKIKVSTVDSYKNGAHDNDEYFEVVENFNFYIADGSINAPYQIRSLNDFEDFLLERNRDENGKYFVLATDIYLNRTFNNSNYATYLNRSLKNHLSGKFVVDENHVYKRSVFGLNINLTNVTNDMNVGLFTNIAEGITLTYFDLDNVSINVTTEADVNLNIGALVGNMDNGIIIASRVKGSIIAVVKGTDTTKAINIGGMVGRYVAGNIMSIPDEGISVNNSDINSTTRIEYTSNISANLGGIAGYMKDVTLSNVRAVPNIVSKNLVMAGINLASSTEYALANIGGIAGYAESSIIQETIVYPTIVGKMNVGGLVGSLKNSSISNSQVQLLYNINMKNVIAGEQNVGGVVGLTEGTCPFNYVYVRSYTTKEFQPFHSDRRNIEFYTDYTSKYYGAIVLLKGVDDAPVGGLIGYGPVNINNSYFMSHVVSYETSAKMGAISGVSAHLNLKNSYVDGKIAYFDHVGKKYYNSFNVISSPTSTTQQFETSTYVDNTVTEGELTSAVGSYITITHTRTWRNATVKYTNNFVSSDIGKFYAKINSTLFGIEKSINGSFSYKSFSDKVEKITVLVYNTGSGLKLYARDEVYENSPNGVTYTNNIIGTEDGSGNLTRGSKVYMWGFGAIDHGVDVGETSKFDEYLVQKLIALDIQKDNYRYFFTGSNAGGINYNSANAYDMFNKFSSLAGAGTYTDLATALTDVASECNIEISSDPNYNKSMFKVIKTVDHSSIELPDSIQNQNEYKAIVHFEVKGNTYSFQTTNSNKVYEFTNVSDDIRSQMVLISDGWAVPTITAETYVGGSIYEITTTTGKQFKLAKEVETFYRLVELGNRSAIGDVAYDAITDFDIETNGSIKYNKAEIWTSIKDTWNQYIVHGPARLIYLDGSYELNSNDEAGEYRIVSDKIYHGNVEVSSNQDAYYAVMRNISVEGGDISITNEKLSGLYGKSSLEDLFEEYEFNYTDGEVKADHSGTTYYRYGNDWYYDGGFASKITEDSILNQLKGKKTNSLYDVIKTAYYNNVDNCWYNDAAFTDKLVYFKPNDDNWYADASTTLLDNAIKSQLIGKYEDTVYYDRKDAYYVSSDQWVYFVDGSVLDLSADSDLKRWLDDNIGNNYYVDVQFNKDANWRYASGAGYVDLNSPFLQGYIESQAGASSDIIIKIYQSRWKNILGNSIVDSGIVGKLHGKTYNTEYNVQATAYYLDNWYIDEAYTNQLNDLTKIEELNGSVSGYTPSLNINPFSIVIDGVKKDISSTTLDVLGINAIINQLGLGPNVGIKIVNNVLYVVGNTTDAIDKAIDTIIINGQTHYVIAKTPIVSVEQSKWLMSEKINDNLPVSLIVNYNMELLYNGSYSNAPAVATYKLYYDELATLALRANEFVKHPNPNDDYIGNDPDNKHGHIKIDDTTVVLMYNKLMSGASGNENVYKMAFGEQDGHYVAVLNGIVVDLSGIEIDKDSALKLVITSTNNNVVSVERDENSNNFNITVKGEGYGELNFYNLKDDSIKVTLKVFVIKGFTNFVVSDNNGSVSSLETIVNGEPSDYVFSFINEVDGYRYEANNGGFMLRLLSIDGKTKADDFVDKVGSKDIIYSTIKINNLIIDKSAFVNDNLEFTFDTPNLSFLATNQYNNGAGSMRFEIIPYVICNGAQIYIEELKKEIGLKISNPAQTINFSETHNEQLPEEEKPVTVSIYSNYDSEKLVLKVSGKDWAADYYVIDGSNYGVIKSAGSLLKFRLKECGTEPTELNGVTMYLHTYTLVFSMNTDEYRTQTLALGHNAIASSISYNFVAYPSTYFDITNDQPLAGAISSNYRLTINPVTASSITTNFYPYMTTYDQHDVVTEKDNKMYGYELDQIYDINALPPDEFGLLRIEINPKYNNTLIVQVEIPSQYTGLVNFQQLISMPYKTINATKYGYYKTLAHILPDGTIDNNGNINMTNTTILWEVPYASTNPALAADPSDIEWIYSEYYLAVYVSEKCPQGVNIPITVRAFDDKRNEILRDVVDLFIEPIPQISISIDNSKSVVKGIDEYVPLQITAENIETAPGALHINTNNLKVYTYNGTNFVECDFNNQVFNSSTQYYVQTVFNGNDYSHSIGTYSIDISTTKNINGIDVSASDSVQLKVVWLTLERVAEVDAISNVVTMQTGMYKGFKVSVTTNKTGLDGIKEFNEKMTDKGIQINGKTPIEYLESVENSIAGRNNYSQSYWEYYINNAYHNLSASGELFPHFMYSRYIGTGSDNQEYFRISAIQTGVLQFRLFFHYAYRSDGTIEVSKNPIVNGWAVEYNFTINIKENSSQDSPIPIYDVEDLIGMEKGVNYILQSDITLENWKPMIFDAAYLDGNGFTISIGSFDMSDLKGREEVYAGIFTRIEEGSIIKNLNINISQLLYNDNALSDARNDEITPNIDLRETPLVYFGTLAGENLGTIINVKVVNLDNRKADNTLYVGITRGYFEYDEVNVISSGYVGGIVATNSGVITNSFIGVNKSEEIERTIKTTNASGAMEFSTVYSYVNSFKIESCNNVGGFAYNNVGTITNSYIKSVDIINNSRVSNGSSTAGFVVYNAGEIYSTAVSTNNIVNFKSADTTITSSSITGGFVHTNSGVIEDSYTNIQIVNQNVETAGFVFKNSGTIKNSYTTTKNTAIESGAGNTDSHGLFVYDKSSYGIIENSYYLILGNELGEAITDAEILRSIDPAHAIIKDVGEEVTAGLFNGFNFATGATEYDGVWYLSDVNKFPELSYAENVNYFSLRQLVNITETYFKAEKKVENGNTTVSMKIYQMDDGVEEVLENFNSLTKKTNVWYFYNGNNMFQVVNNVILEVTTDTAMEITVNQSAGAFEFAYNGTNYAVYYNEYHKDDGYTVKINGTSKQFVNYSFTYLGFEFIVIREGNNFKMTTNNGFSVVVLSGLATPNTFVYGGNSTYTYMYVKNNPGSKFNPLIVTNSEEFAKYIVNNTNEYILQDNSRVYIFGLVENAGDGVYSRYIHLAQDITFRNEEEETDKNIAASYEVNNSTAKITINDVIFNGVLIGNSMSIDNIILNSTQVRENYGIFNEVGVNDGLRQELKLCGYTTFATAQVFNTKLSYEELSNSSANKVGLLAGTISNAIINKIDISGVEQVDNKSQIIGQNLVGALAGLIYGTDDKTKVSEITVSNANVLSTVNQLSNLNSTTIATDQGYKEFKESGGSVTSHVRELEFGSYYSRKDNTEYPNIRVLKNLKDPTKAPSYAGAIAGAIVIDSKIDDDVLQQNKLDNYTSYDALRSATQYFHVRDLKVSNTINIQADVAGGIAGYIGAKDPTAGATPTYYGAFMSDLELELDNAAQQNIYGYAYAGGIVGQTHNAYFMQTVVSHPKEIQDSIDQKINTIESKDISNRDLFSKNKDTSKYNVAIGGIVGRMNNTWIVDSLSKVNVENKNSFIGGGIAGHVTGSSYLAYVYTTGNVLAKNMIGGLIGYYYKDNGQTYNLNLYNAYAVNVWNKTIKDLLKVNEKAYKYTGLTEEQKTLMGEFNSMPELGNQNVSRSTVVINTISLTLLDKTVQGSGVTGNNVVLKNGSDVIYRFRFSSDGEEKVVRYLGYEFTLVWSGTNGVSCIETETPVPGEPLTSYYSVDYSVSGTAPNITSKSVAISPHATIQINTNYLGFASYERFTYIGSILGRYSEYRLNNHQDLLEDVVFYNSVGESINEIIARTNIAAGGENEEYYTYYNKYNFNVISSTYGKVKHNGSISEGDYSSIIADDKINLSYFKSIYGVSGTADGGRYDSSNIDNFKPVFGKQYYISYITGDFINNSTDEKVGNKYYKNEFTSYYGYAYDVVETNTAEALWNPTVNTNGLYLSKANLDSLNTKIASNAIDSLEFGITGVGFEPSYTWYVDNQYYLAKYGHNSNDTFGLVDDEESLYDALTLGKSGMMYRIDKNNDHSTSAKCGSTDKKVYHLDGTQAGLYQLGTSDTRFNITNNIYYAAEPITIKFKPSQANGVVHLFDIITSTTFMNITFEIDLSEVEEVRTKNLENYFGVFANVANGVVFNGCKFVLKNAGELKVASANDSAEEYVESMGLVIGFASNSVFTKCEFNYGFEAATSPLNLGYSTINFGAFAGNSWQSTFIDMTIKATTKMNVVYSVTTGNEDKDDTAHSFGGFLGLAQSSRIENINFEGVSSFTGTNMQDINYNFGSFIGRVQGDTSLRTITVKHTSDVKISATATALGTLNAGIVGFVDRIGYIENLSITGGTNTALYISLAQNINVNFGAFGLVQASSSRLTIQNVTNSLATQVHNFIYTGATRASTLNVGGLVGNKTTTSVLVIEKCINLKEITLAAIKNNDDPDSDYKVITVNAGGLVGRSSGINVKQSVNLGNLNLSSSDNNVNEKVTIGTSDFYNNLNVGGIVGFNNSGSVNLNNVINYGDQIFVVSDNKNYRIGGLIGNAGDRAITTTYALALGNIINQSSTALVSKESINGFAHNFRELNNTGSHYVAEHDPRTAYDTTLNTSLNYKVEGLTNSDVITIAWQYMDFLEDGDKSLSSDINCLIKWKSSDSSDLPVVDGISYTVTTTSGTKYNPKEITSFTSTSISSSTAKYYLVADESEQTTNVSIPVGSIVSSKTKSGVTVKVADGKLITSNKGTISNIIFQTQKESITSGGALFMTTNDGYLMNVGFNDAGSIVIITSSSANIAPITTNNGGIYATGSLISIRKNNSAGDTLYSGGEFSYLVHTNSSTGVIAESYTRGQAQGAGTGNVKFGAIATTNSGVIKNTYFSGDFKLTGITLTKAHSNLTNDSAPTSSYSNRTGMAGGNKSESGIKQLIVDGLLKSHMWSTEDATYPYIKGSIKLTTSFVNGQFIYTIVELNNWIDTIVGNGGVNEMSVNVQLDADGLADEENRVVKGTITENKGTINFICIVQPASGSQVTFQDVFVETNNGSVVFNNTNNVRFMKTIIATNSNTDEDVSFALNACRFDDDADIITTNSGVASIEMTDTIISSTGYLVETNSSELTINKILYASGSQAVKIASNTGTITFGASDGIVKHTQMEMTANTGSITTTSGYKTFSDSSELLIGENGSTGGISNLGFHNSQLKVIKNTANSAITETSKIIYNLSFEDESANSADTPEFTININEGTVHTINMNKADFKIIPKLSSGNAEDITNNGCNNGTLSTFNITDGSFIIAQANNASGVALGGINKGTISGLTTSNSNVEMVNNASGATISSVTMTEGSGTAMSKSFKITGSDGNQGAMDTLSFTKCKFSMPVNAGTISGLTMVGNGATETSFGDIIASNTGTIDTILVQLAKLTKPLILNNSGTIGSATSGDIKFENVSYSESGSASTATHSSLLCGKSIGDNAQIISSASNKIRFYQCSLTATGRSTDGTDAGFVCAEMDGGPSGVALNAIVEINDCAMNVGTIIDAGTVVGDLCSIAKGSISVIGGTLTAVNNDTTGGGVGGAFGLIQWAGGGLETSACSSSIAITVSASSYNQNIGGVVGHFQGTNKNDTTKYSYFGAGAVSFSGSITLKTGSKAKNVGGIVGNLQCMTAHTSVSYSFTGSIHLENNSGVSTNVFIPWESSCTSESGGKGLSAYTLFGGNDPYYHSSEGYVDVWHKPGGSNVNDDGGSYWFNVLYGFDLYVGPLAGEFGTNYSKLTSKVTANTGAVYGLDTVGFVPGIEIVRYRDEDSSWQDGNDDMYSISYRTIWKFASSITGVNTFSMKDTTTSWYKAINTPDQEGAFRTTVYNAFNLQQVVNEAREDPHFVQHQAGASYGAPYTNIKYLSINIDSIWHEGVWDEDANECRNTTQYYVKCGTVEEIMASMTKYDPLNPIDFSWSVSHGND